MTKASDFKSMVNVLFKYFIPCYYSLDLLLTLVMLNKKMPCLLIFSQPDRLIQIVDMDSNTEWQTVQIQISWLLQKLTDLDLHCLQTQGIIWVQQDKG